MLERAFLYNIILVGIISSKTVEINENYSFQRIKQRTMTNCVYDKDCIENAYCWNREACYCMDGYLINGNRTFFQCLKIITRIGDSCITDVQCQMTFGAQAECRNSVCTCAEGSHYEAESKRCYESVGIGSLCQTSYNCRTNGSASFCVDGFCSCPLQHHPNADGTACLRNSVLGDECATDEECIDANARCFGTCICRVEYVPSDDGKRCLKAANAMGEPCEEDSQCTAFLKNAKCGEDKTCTCLMDLKKSPSTCLMKINPEMLGKECINRIQCVQPIIPETLLYETEITNVDCINGICSCSDGYTLSEEVDDCVRFSDNATSSSKDSCTFILMYILLFEFMYLHHMD